MIDMHSHILPQMDDGSKSVEMTMAMLRMLGQQGVDTVVATPHFLAAKDSPEEFLRRREEALARLIDDMTDLPRILPGAEVTYFDGMSRSGELETLCLGDSRLVLVEMPYGVWTERMVREVCDIPVQLGLQPVLAHVDRYREQFARFYRHLADQGMLFQFNADVFAGFWSRRWALKMLRGGKLHFMGSDCHNLEKRPPQMGQAAQVITDKLGMGFLEEMTAYAADALGV